MAIDKHAHHQQIIEYYDKAEVSYRDVWDLKESMAMHYGFWDETTPNLRAALRRQNEVLAETGRIQAHERVLDAGCGVGGSSIFLAQTIGCSVTGITLNANQVNKATANSKAKGVADKTHFQVADYCNTPFEDASFDVVWAIECVGYAVDKSDFLREAFRLLKPGGRLVISEQFLGKEQMTSEEREMVDKWLKGWACDDTITAESFATLAKQEGFRNISLTDHTAKTKKSAWRLYFWARLALWYGKLMRLFGKKYGSDVSINNTIGAIYQYKALKRGLWKHIIFYGEK